MQTVCEDSLYGNQALFNRSLIFPLGLTVLMQIVSSELRTSASLTNTYLLSFVKYILYCVTLKVVWHFLVTSLLQMYKSIHLRLFKVNCSVILSV